MFIGVNAAKFGAMMEDAAKRAGVNAAELSFFSWPQEWPDTNCGFGGIAGRANTSAQTFLFLFQDEANAWQGLIYHDCRFAYRVLEFDAETFLAKVQQALPGVVETKRSKVKGIVYE